MKISRKVAEYMGLSYDESAPEGFHYCAAGVKPCCPCLQAAMDAADSAEAINTELVAALVELLSISNNQTTAAEQARKALAKARGAA